MVNYYETLGVSHDASTNEIRKAYRRLAFKYHPDRNHGDPDAEKLMQSINEAHDELSDDGKRARHDYNLREWEQQESARREQQERAQQEQRERAQQEQREHAQRAQQERDQREQRERDQQEGAQSSARNTAAAHSPVAPQRRHSVWSAIIQSAVIQSAILLAIIILASGIAIAIPAARDWLVLTLGYGWVSVGVLIAITPVFWSMLDNNEHFWGLRLWLASAVAAAISIIAMSLIDGGSGYGVSGLWGHALTGGGKPFIAAIELFIAVELLIPLLVPNGYAANIAMGVVFVLAVLALVGWLIYIVVMWVIANFIIVAFVTIFLFIVAMGITASARR